MTDPIQSRMTPLEIRASISLASIFALRLLGLFLILPVFAVYAQTIPGGTDATLVGLALGIYGLTQGVLQIPYGAASDRWGRKPVIAAGLVVFAAGSFIAALATDIVWTIVGRAIQGAGAISAAVTAFIADSTRDEHRTKAMALVGGSVALTFAGSLVLAPLLYPTIGVRGLFALTGVLVVMAIGVLVLGRAGGRRPAAVETNGDECDHTGRVVRRPVASPQRRHFCLACRADGNVCRHSNFAGPARFASVRTLEDLLSGGDVVICPDGKAIDRGRASWFDASTLHRVDRAGAGGTTRILATR